jgi:hypothetical protein
MKLQRSARRCPALGAVSLRGTADADAQSGPRAQVAACVPGVKRVNSELPLASGSWLPCRKLPVSILLSLAE